MRSVCRVIPLCVCLCGTALAALAEDAAGPVRFIEDVKVSAVASKDASYGKMWTGELTYDLSSEKPEVWTWLELSTDGGKTWSAGRAQGIGHVGTVAPGKQRKVLWVVDGGEAAAFKFRIRVNEQPAVYHLHNTESLQTAVTSPEECPKPIPEADPYATLERMINRDEHMFDLSQIGPYAFQPATLDLEATTGVGEELVVGFGDSPLPPDRNGRPRDPKMRIRATYLKVGQMQFAVISKNSIRNVVEVVQQEKAAIEERLGIPRTQIMHNWCHQHYADDGELAIEQSVAALTKAKQSARPARMAVIVVQTGPGSNYYRSGQSSKDVFTDGPIDDRLVGVLFVGKDGKPIGSWIRFTGHSAAAPALSAEMERRWGGVCSFLNGNAGNINTTLGLSAEGGKYSPTAIVDLILKQAPKAEFRDVTRMGVAWGTTKYYGVETLIQCFRLGDWYFPAYYAEPPVEQALVTGALIGFDRTVVVGYANGRAGPGGGYYTWHNRGTGIMRWGVLRMTQLTVRCANILALPPATPSGRWRR